MITVSLELGPQAAYNGIYISWQIYFFKYHPSTYFKSQLQTPSWLSLCTRILIMRDTSGPEHCARRTQMETEGAMARSWETPTAAGRRDRPLKGLPLATQVGVNAEYASSTQKIETYESIHRSLWHLSWARLFNRSNFMVAAMLYINLTGNQNIQDLSLDHVDFPMQTLTRTVKIIIWKFEKCVDATVTITKHHYWA